MAVTTTEQEQVGMVLDVDEDESPDMMEVTAAAGTLRVRCLLLIGGLAELVVEDGDPDDVLRHPAADVAAQAGVPVAELPGKVLAVRVDEGAGERRLSGFRLAD